MVLTFKDIENGNDKNTGNINKETTVNVSNTKVFVFSKNFFFSDAYQKWQNIYEMVLLIYSICMCC